MRRVQVIQRILIIIYSLLLCFTYSSNVQYPHSLEPTSQAESLTTRDSTRFLKSSFIENCKTTRNTDTTTICETCETNYINMGYRCIKNEQSSDISDVSSYKDSIEYTIMSLLLISIVNTIIVGIVGNKCCRNSGNNNLQSCCIILSTIVAFNSLQGTSNLSLKPSALSTRISFMSSLGIIESTNWIVSLIQDNQQASSADSLSSASSAVLWITYLLIIYFTLKTMISKQILVGYTVFSHGVGSLLFQATVILVNALIFYAMKAISQNQIYLNSSSDNTLTTILNAIFIAIGLLFTGCITFQVYRMSNLTPQGNIANEPPSFEEVCRRIVCIHPSWNGDKDRWVQKNYSLIQFYRVIIIYPSVIALLGDSPVACASIVTGIQIIAVVFVVYVRPMQDPLGNVIEIVIEVLSLIVIGLVLSGQIIGLYLSNFSEAYDEWNVNLLDRMRMADISSYAIVIVILCVVQIRSWGDIRRMIIKKKQDEEEQTVVFIKAFDSIERIQRKLLDYGWEDSPCFKIRPEYVQNLQMQQSFKNYTKRRRSAFAKEQVLELGPSNETSSNSKNSTHFNQSPRLTRSPQKTSSTGKISPFDRQQPALERIHPNDML